MAVPKQKPGLSKQNYQTPITFIEAVKKRWHIKDFSLDLAASDENAVAVHYYTEAQDALKLSWQAGGAAWLNPPYANITPWVKKAYEECLKGQDIFMLVPASVGANWWRDYVHEKAYIYFLNGRLAFMRDKPKWLYPKDCALLLYLHEGELPSYDIWSWK